MSGSFERVLSVVLVFLVVCKVTKDCAVAQELKSPTLGFKRHGIIQPVVHHGKTGTPIQTTRDANGAHHSEVTLTVLVESEEYVLDLRLNKDLVAGDHTLHYQDRGHTVKHKPNIEEIDLCHYSGSVRGKPSSWAAVSTCNGVSGVIFDGQMMRYIQPAEDSEAPSRHYIYNHEDLITNNHRGFLGGTTNNTKHGSELWKKHQKREEIKNSRINRVKRDSPNSQVREPFDANILSRYIELVLVVDRSLFKANDENVKSVQSRMIHLTNVINSVYSPINIYVALVGVVIWTEEDEIQIDERGEWTHKNFLEYRMKKLVPEIPNDIAFLITNQLFSEGRFGLTNGGQICTLQGSGGLYSNFSDVLDVVAIAVAHEIGHSLGISHDTYDETCHCPENICIMNQFSNPEIPTHWSSCSLKALALSFARGMDYCLRNKPKRLFDSPTCGNGFIEPGEQCDCGLVPGGGANPCHACCHPDTCMLRSNATCGAGTCCDFKTCRRKAAGTLCRATHRECDLPELCSGLAEFCPEDVYKMDTTPCGQPSNQAYCIQGSCRSHNDQCRLLWGPSSESSNDMCYTTRKFNGTQYMNCGHDPINETYKPCSPNDVLCGMLQCRQLNETLLFGEESTAIQSAIYVVDNGVKIPCHSAMIDFGVSDVDPGLVPDGAKCGDGKMCLSQRCLSIATVRESIADGESSICTFNCSAHDFCVGRYSSRCPTALSPSLMLSVSSTPGPVDSGATDPSAQNMVVIAMYAIFLGIIPLIVLILFIVYCSRGKMIWWKKPRKSDQQRKNDDIGNEEAAEEENDSCAMAALVGVNQTCDGSKLNVSSAPSTNISVSVT